MYQAEPIRQMMRRGIAELTQAPSWIDAWRRLFEKGDVVGIKVSPVGGKKRLLGRPRDARDSPASMKPGFARQMSSSSTATGRRC